MKNYKMLCAVLFSLFVLFANNRAQEKQNGDFLTRAIDKSVDPSVDFFKYATGTWMKNNPIPESERAWGIANLVMEETYSRVKRILQEAQKSKSPVGSNEQKIGDFYFSGMDTFNIEKQGITPLKPELEKIDQINNKEDLINVITFLKREGVGAMFGIGVGQDDKNSEQYALFMY